MLVPDGDGGHKSGVGAAKGRGERSHHLQKWCGGVSCRTVMVLDRLKGRTVAFCHLKQEIKTLCSLKNHPRRTPLITLNPKMSTVPFWA
ncbi:MAG: hypothetical protein ACTSRF_11625 [Candidatus Freyarchaeota archaeon]